MHASEAGHILGGSETSVSVLQRGASTEAEQAAATTRVLNFLAAKWLPRGVSKP